MRDNTKTLTGVIEKLWLPRTEKQNARKRIHVLSDKKRGISTIWNVCNFICKSHGFLLLKPNYTDAAL